MDYLDELLRIAQSSIKAYGFLGKTVVKLNEDSLIDASEIIKNGGNVVTLGIKNTGQINRKYIRKLIDTKRYVWHTIDHMADGGRAVDINLVNPVTLRPMTGSSSATAINVLYGINDIGIGTDGGGSVLAPALSLNLYSIMAKGMGLKGSMNRLSTDGISFTPGIGVISQSFGLAKSAVYDMLDIKDNNVNLKGIKVAVCRDRCIVLPDGRDMNEKSTLVLNRLRKNGIDVNEEEMPDFTDRKEAISKIDKLFNLYDIIITCEGPVDLMGLGDSVFGTMGQFAGRLQGRAGKYMVKVANMLDATSITIPIDEVASGIVITSRVGMEEGIRAIRLAEELLNLYKLPELYYSYFKNGCLKRKSDLIFSLEGV